jgi:hypothetical protein
LDAEAEHWALRYAEECPDRRVALQAQPSPERPVSPNRGPSLFLSCVSRWDPRIRIFANGPS